MCDIAKKFFGMIKLKLEEYQISQRKHRTSESYHFNAGRSEKKKHNNSKLALFLIGLGVACIDVRYERQQSPKPQVGYLKARLITYQRSGQNQLVSNKVIFAFRNSTVHELLNSYVTGRFQQKILILLLIQILSAFLKFHQVKRKHFMLD